ncbi:MAG: zinc-dependent metalloprotease, partial [Chloroflexales bacterium]|nr:zinc-dependent metalloprotease [Chloroflexales bacterium]
AIMSLVEGYSNHIMNAIGRRLLPSFDQIEQRVESRQRNRTLFEQVFNRVTGMDLKLAQYQQGEAFVNAVVNARGIAFASRVWERAEHLPTLAEIRAPQQWIERMDRM